MNNKVAIYCRLSKEDLYLKDNEESESIQNQKKMLIDYSLKHNWEIYNIYSDEDYAGSDNKRPEWNRMLQDAENKKFNIILCKSQSRFSRLQEIVEKYINGKFLEWGVRFVSIIDNADTEIKSNKKARQINGLINEWYIEDLSDNIRAVFKSKMEQGQFLSSFAPLGYIKDPMDKHHLIIDKEYAPIIKQIFQWNYEGVGGQKIARKLNDMAIPTPRKIQEIKGLRKTKLYSDDDNGIWSARAITQILKNRTYCGDTVQHTTEKVNYKSEYRRNIPKSDWIIVENTHEPIISKEIFFSLKEQKEKRGYNRTAKDKHPLAGVVKCHCCMKPMQKNHSKTSAKVINYLRCRDKYSYTDKMKCDTPNIRIDMIMNFIHGDLIKKISEEELNSNTTLEEFIKNKSKKNIEINFLKNKLEDIRAELSKYSKAINELYLDKVNGIITQEQFIEYNYNFTQQKKDYEIKEKEIQEKIKGFHEAKQFNDETFKKQFILIKKFIQDEIISNNIIHFLIKDIIWGEIDKNTGKRKLVINWNF